jgi:hypothetical protein
MSAQVTVPIVLSEEEAARLQAWARRQGVSVSELVRRLVRQAGPEAAAPLTDEEYDNDPLWSIVGLVETGTVDGFSEPRSLSVRDRCAGARVAAGRNNGAPCGRASSGTPPVGWRSTTSVTRTI